MSKLMQSRIVLKGGEIDFARTALEEASARLKAAGAPDMARPYDDLIGQIDTTRKYGDGKSAAVTAIGGGIDCFKAALGAAADKAEGARLAELVRKQTRGLGKFA